MTSKQVAMASTLGFLSAHEAFLKNGCQTEKLRSSYFMVFTNSTNLPS